MVTRWSQALACPFPLRMLFHDRSPIASKKSTTNSKTFCGRLWQWANVTAITYVVNVPQFEAAVRASRDKLARRQEAHVGHGLVVPLEGKDLFHR